MGRPTLLTPELQAAIVADVERGHYDHVVAQAHGVSYDTFRAWKRWGREGREPYQAFYTAVARAKHQAELDLAAVALSGDEKGVSNGPAKAAAWMLERTRGARYAPRINLKVESELEDMLDVAERVLSAEDFATLCEALAARASGEEAGEDSSGQDGEPSAGPH